MAALAHLLPAFLSFQVGTCSPIAGSRSGYHFFLYCFVCRRWEAYLPMHADIGYRRVTSAAAVITAIADVSREFLVRLFKRCVYN